MIATRPYRSFDFDSIDRLWRACFVDDPIHNHADISIPAREAHQDGLFLVAEDGSTVLGSIMAGYDGHRGWLYAVAVDPAHRRRAIGTLLVRAAEARLTELGCVKINLQVRTENAAVARFYHRLGYNVEERISMGRLLAI